MMGGGQRSVRNVFDPMDLRQGEITPTCACLDPRPLASGLSQKGLGFRLHMCSVSTLICL